MALADKRLSEGAFLHEEGSYYEKHKAKLDADNAKYGTFARTIDGVRSGVGKAADTVFGGFGDDEVLAVDAYDIRDSENKNRVFEAAKEGANDASALLRRQAGAVSEAVALARTKTQNMVEDSEIRRRVQGLLNDANSFGKFSANAQQKIFGALRGSADRAVGMVKTVIGDTTSVLDYACTSVTGGIMDLLGDLTGNGALARIFDFRLESVFFSALMDDAMVCGVDVTGLIRDHASDNIVFKTAMALSAPKALQIGKIENVARILDVTGRDGVLGEVPDAVSRMLAGYKLDRRTTPDQHPEKYEELTGMLTTLDEGWDSVKVGARKVIDLEVFRNASEDVKTILGQNDTYRTAILTAPHYQPQAMSGIAQGMYPHAPIQAVA